MLREILNEIALQLSKTIPEIELSIVHKNNKELYTLAHLLKPTIAIINNAIILDLLIKTEHAALNNTNDVKLTCFEFIKQLKKLNSYINKLKI